MTDRERFLNTAKDYIGTNGSYVCNTKLGLGAVYDWCAFSVSAIMKDCGFIGKYMKAVEGGAGSIPRAADGKYGEWFKKGTKVPQAGDLFFMRYADYPYQDKYFCDHVGIVESVNGNAITTLEGNVDGYNYNWAGTSTFKRKTRYLSDGTVYAFYRPFWKSEAKTTSTNTQKKTEIYDVNSSAKVNYFVKVTCSDGLNIRQGASTKRNILGTVSENEILKITNQTSGSGYTWGLTEYDGIKGWIALNYTEKIDIEKLAHDVIQGKYGNGEERKEKLGSLYDDVQKHVNYILSKK